MSVTLSLPNLAWQNNYNSEYLELTLSHIFFKQNHHHKSSNLPNFTSLKYFNHITYLHVSLIDISHFPS